MTVDNETIAAIDGDYNDNRSSDGNDTEKQQITVTVKQHGIKIWSRGDGDREFVGAMIRRDGVATAMAHYVVIMFLVTPGLILCDVHQVCFRPVFRNFYGREAHLVIQFQCLTWKSTHGRATANEVWQKLDDH